MKVLIARHTKEKSTSREAAISCCLCAEPRRCRHQPHRAVRIIEMGQRMLRFLVGVTLLISAITLSSHAPARGEPPAADNGLSDLRQQLEGKRSFSPPLTLEGLLHRTEEETERQWKRLQQNVMERDLIYEKMLSLARVGPTFGFEAVDGLHPLQRVRAACLVGETGKIYMYDFEKDGAHTFGVVDWREFSKAVDLAKSLEHVEWRPVPARTLKHVDGKNIRELIWYVLWDGRNIPLRIAGDYVGAHPNPQVAQLVKLIDGWCPYSEIRSRLELPSFEAVPRPPY